MKIRWTDEMGVGIPELDAEHRELVETYNQLVDAWHDGEGFVGAATILNELTGRVRFHTMREEGLLEGQAPAELEEHRREHADFIRDLEEFEHRLLTDGDRAGKDISLEILGQRLTDHTLGCDREAVRRLRARDP